MNNFSWGKLNDREKISIFVFCLVLIMYLFYDFILAPKWQQIDELNAQLATEQQQVKVVENFQVAHPNQEAFLIELDSKIIHVGTMLPDNPEISTLLVQFEQLSRECGVKLNYLKPTKINNKDKEGYREFEIEFSINGTFAQNMDFLNKTERGLRFINITGITMQIDKKNLDSKITAKVYSFGVPATKAQIPPGAVAPAKDKEKDAKTATDNKAATPTSAPPVPNNSPKK